jgi:hypothetical protein
LSNVAVGPWEIEHAFDFVDYDAIVVGARRSTSEEKLPIIFCNPKSATLIRATHPGHARH